jgi:hypothetical protein
MARSAALIRALVPSLLTPKHATVCRAFIGGLSVVDDIKHGQSCHIAVGTPGGYLRHDTWNEVPVSLSMAVHGTTDLGPKSAPIVAAIRDYLVTSPQCDWQGGSRRY